MTISESIYIMKRLNKNMPIDKPLIQNKLAQLDVYIKRIDKVHLEEKQLMEDVDQQDLLTFRLLQTVEICLDIATHIIAALDLEKPETARGSFEVLAKNGVIAGELANKLSHAVSFRNLAVHAYEGFDFQRLFADYKKDILDLKEFVKEIIVFLDKN